MRQRIVVAGKDTGFGRTALSAGLADLLGANCWTSIGPGLYGEADNGRVAQLGNLPVDRIVTELNRLRMSTSLHHSSEIDGVRSDTAVARCAGYRGGAARVETGCRRTGPSLTGRVDLRGLMGW
ncbi:AAA family ATPase [Bradyrhizobium erythrophlei]|uniref:AAA family ATPase n=1 Tax=Bradyrhizobium erythrophlei TaxID=1437360 RepID=UPI0035EFC9B3